MQHAKKRAHVELCAKHSGHKKDKLGLSLFEDV